MGIDDEIMFIAPFLMSTGDELEVSGVAQTSWGFVFAYLLLYHFSRQVNGYSKTHHSQ
jgi:hypothetical protein